MDWISSAYDWLVEVISSIFSNEFVLVIVAALIAYLFALKAQRATLREQHKLSVYDGIWKRRDELSSSIISLATHIGGLGTEYVMIESIDRSRTTMGNIIKKPSHEYDHDMRERWNEYNKKVGEYGSTMFEAFGKLHSNFEQTFFMYPHLKQSFFLLRDEYQLIFDLHQKLISIVYDVDGPLLIEKKHQDELGKKVKELDIIEQLINFQVYLDDYFKLVQHSLAGELFKFKPDERKPVIGKILTPSGWKLTKSSSDNVFDKKMLRKAVTVAEKSNEPLKCGVILVDKDNQVITSTYNSQRKDKLAINHAEIKAIGEANKKLNSRKLKEVTVYCSCEPCPMCLTALIFASVKRIVFATPLNTLNPKDKQIYIESYSFINRFPNPPVLEWVELE